MKTLIDTHNITLQELNSMTDSEKRIFESISSQFLTKQTITEKQNDLLIKILKREFDISNIEFTKYNLYREYFYKLDHHEDYFKTSKCKIAKELDLSETIQNLHASQYNYSDRTNRYELQGIIAVPACIKDLDEYIHYRDIFEKAYRKFKNTRTANSKYAYIKIIKTILSEEYDEKILKLISWRLL